MSWSEPIRPGFRVLDDIDIWVVQIAERPEVTKEGKPPDHAYTFVKLDRGTDDDDLRKQIVKRECPEYIKLWRLAKEAWSMEKPLCNSDGSDIKTLLVAATEYCQKFLALRQEIRESLDMTKKFEKDLYETSVQCHRLLMDLRSQLLYIQRTPDVDAEDAIWEVYKGFSGYNPVQDPQDVEVVIVTIGAVCPRAYERKNKGALQKFIDECSWNAEKPKKWSPEWLDFVLGQMISYGAYANLEEQCFLHEDDAIPWAVDQLGSMGCMLGFALDRQANAIGSTGWDFLSGDITAGLRRPPPKGKELEHGLMRKISGLEEPQPQPES